jgi:hypothetical protein
MASDARESHQKLLAHLSFQLDHTRSVMALYENLHVFVFSYKKKTNSVALSPRANYTD